ncbi:hypothetical protein [Flavobacterium sp.]|uniref:hypothetical protein n=1 Tax=Flavobacterium sp. TaxID=239 RepID=UPI001226EA6C|nr:hypothetical protein [Flavobacterium sp.]RZJ73894.1 MAG: hypothetical protein EOO49_00625 [Flavobacterium sp.]
MSETALYPCFRQLLSTTATATAFRYCFLLLQLLLLLPLPSATILSGRAGSNKVRGKKKRWASCRQAGATRFLHAKFCKGKFEVAKELKQ